MRWCALAVFFTGIWALARAQVREQEPLAHQRGVPTPRPARRPPTPRPTQKLPEEAGLRAPRPRETPDPELGAQPHKAGKPCTVDGVRIHHGAVWSPRPCSVCACEQGTVVCVPIECPVLHCRGARTPRGACCPVCPGGTATDGPSNSAPVRHGIPPARSDGKAGSRDDRDSKSGKGTGVALPSGKRGPGPWLRTGGRREPPGGTRGTPRKVGAMEAVLIGKSEGPVGKQEAGVEKQEVGIEKQEAGTRKQEARAGKQEAQARKQEARAGKQEAGIKKQEAGTRKQETGAGKQEAGARKQEAGVKKKEMGVKKKEMGVKKQEAGVKKQEAGNEKQEAGVKKQEVDVKNQEAGIKKQEIDVKKQEVGVIKQEVGLRKPERPLKKPRVGPVKLVTRSRDVGPKRVEGGLGQTGPGRAAVEAAQDRPRKSRPGLEKPAAAAGGKRGADQKQDVPPRTGRGKQEAGTRTQEVPSRADREKQEVGTQKQEVLPKQGRGKQEAGTRKQEVPRRADREKQEAGGRKQEVGLTDGQVPFPPELLPPPESEAGMPSLPAGCILAEMAIACPGNQLRAVPALVDSGLHTLYLADNVITAISSSDLSRLPNLQWLDLSRNRLSDEGVWRNAFRNLTRLRRLNLDGNRLSTIPPLPPSLQELKLNDNRLLTVDRGSFRGLARLLTLDLEGNGLHDGNLHPGSFRPLRKLIYLRLGRNRFRALPAGLPPSLRELHLESNVIEEVPGGLLNKTTNLTILILRNNTLQENRISPQAWFHLRNLETLDLSHNCLVHVPSFLPTGLKQLLLHHNQIERIPGYVFAHLKPGLEFLHLSYNNLRNDGIHAVSFRGLYTSLQELLLDHNQLRAVPRGILKLRVLQALRLSDNHIRHVPMDSICDTQMAEDSSLVSIHLENNLIDRRSIPPFAFSCIRSYQSIVIRPQRHED